MWMFILEVLVLGVLGSILGLAFGSVLYLELSSTFVLLQNLPVGLSNAEVSLIGLLGLGFGTFVCLFGALSSIIRLSGREPFSSIKEV